jgi:hypothetical protein
MAISLSGEDPRGPRRGAKGSCGTPGTPWVSSPAHRVRQAEIEGRAHARGRWEHGRAAGGA